MTDRHHEELREGDPEFEALVEAEILHLRVHAEAVRRYRQRYPDAPLKLDGLPPVGTGFVLGRPQQAAMHEHLRKHGPTHVTEIATATGRTRVRVREAVNRLIRAGYARECDAPADYDGPRHTRWIEAVGVFPTDNIADPMSWECATVNAVRALCIRHGSTFVTEIAGALGLERNTVEYRVEKLIERGYLEFTDPSNRATPYNRNARLLWFVGGVTPEAVCHEEAS